MTVTLLRKVWAAKISFSDSRDAVPSDGRRPWLCLFAHKSSVPAAGHFTSREQRHPTGTSFSTRAREKAAAKLQRKLYLLPSFPKNRMSRKVRVWSFGCAPGAGDGEKTHPSALTSLISRVKRGSGQQVAQVTQASRKRNEVYSHKRLTQTLLTGQWHASIISVKQGRGQFDTSWSNSPKSRD